MSELVEHIGDDFGATVIYTLDDQFHHHVEFFVADIVARGERGEALYERAGSGNSIDHVTDPHGAEPMFRGSVKWDGCSHVYFGEADNQGYLHLCGRSNIDKLADVLAKVYERCGELMHERGVDLLEGEFKCGPK